MVNFYMQIKAKANEEQLKKNISVKKQYWFEKDFNSKKEKNFLEKKINPVLS